MILDSKQLEVINHFGGHVAILASAGSGKTSTSVRRIKNLIENGVEPSRILAASFTNKSAGEMKERVMKVCGELAEDVSVSTIHSFCYDVLKRFENTSTSKISVVREFDVWVYLGNYLKKEESVLKDIKGLILKISQTKLNLITVNDLFKQVEPLLKVSTLNCRNDETIAFYEIYRDYEAWLKSKNKVDFSDMLLKTYLHLKEPSEKRNKVIRKIDYIIVDEAQDANLVSYEIYKILASENNNLMLIGDMKQSIFSFQGSSYTYIQKFLEELGAKKIELEKNYRSTKTIVENGNKLIRFDSDFSDTNCYTDNEQGEPISLMISSNEVEEADYISEELKRIHESGVAYKDMAVIFRVNAQSMPIVDSLTLKEIPFVLHAKGSFYKRKEVRQVVAYLKAFTSPERLTLEDMKLIANAPNRYIRNDSLEIAFNQARLAKSSILTAMKKINYDNPRQNDAVRSLASDIENGFRFFLHGENITTRQLIEYVFNNLGFVRHIESGDSEHEADNDRSMNLDILYTACDSRSEPITFVHYAENMANRNDEDNKTDGVHLMTIHASKGLEFKVVVVAGVSTRLLPFHRADTIEQQREERRLAYVAVTRPEKKLILSAINGKFGKFNVEPSPFIRDMGLLGANT